MTKVSSLEGYHQTRRGNGKAGFALLGFMGKMRGDNIVRPRRQIGRPSENHVVAGNLAIFKIGEGDFVIPIKESDKKFPRTKEVRPKGITKQLFQQFENYCDKTTLHGLRYVGDNNLTIGERIFWFVAFSFAIGFAAYYISNIYEKWNSSPVIISFSPFDGDLSSIPFPAVTICNMNQAKKNEAEKLIAEGDTVQMKLLNDVCNGNKTFNDSTQYNWTTLSNFLIRTGNSCSDMLRKCEWSSEGRNCDDFFNNDLTDEGLCCSFNRLPPDKIFRNPNDVSLLNQTYPENVFDWNPESGFNDDTYYGNDDNVIPKRPLGAGAHLGLTVVLDAQVDNYYCSSTSSVGFKILISNPIETPKMADFGSLLMPGVEIRYAITPNVREASDRLRDIAVAKRQCYFINERRLQYYRHYSKVNCLQECLSLYIFKFCKCVPYYLPKNDSMKYCEQTDDVCVSKTRRIIYQENGGRTLCKCYAGCAGISYTYRESRGKIFLDDFTTLNVSNKYARKSIAIVQIFFEKDYFNKMHKAKLYHFTDFVGNTGGLLSLFLGFSILSAFEMMYYLVWKTAWKMYKDYQNRPKSYTQRNCNLECQSNYTFANCKCISYYLPRTKNIKVCGQKDSACVALAKENMEKVYGNGSSCHCLPGCYEVIFTDSKSYGQLSFSNLHYSIETISQQYISDNIAVAHFYFPGSKFSKQLKSELYGFTEILANAGGLLGLCMGFSFLSLVEVLYYLTLKMFCYHVKNRVKKLKNEDHQQFGNNNALPFLK